MFDYGYVFDCLQITFIELCWLYFKFGLACFVAFIIVLGLLLYCYVLFRFIYLVDFCVCCLCLCFGYFGSDRFLIWCYWCFVCLFCCYLGLVD